MSYWQTDRQTDGAWEREKGKYRYKKLKRGTPKKDEGGMITEDKEKKIAYREKVGQETKKRKEISDRTDKKQKKKKR